MAEMAPSMASAGMVASDPAVEFVTEPEDEAAYLFDAATVRTYNIVVAAADLSMIDAQPSAEQWVPAQLEFEGQTHGPFMMRYKGSDGSFKAPCTTGDPDGPKAAKCSIKLGFDEVDETKRFYGLKKLNFHAMNNDGSMLRDRLGYALFRESNLVAPRAMHAKVLINGELSGLFVAVEQIDGRFTRARFSEGGEGNVYKGSWPSRNGEAEFLAALETNSELQDVSGMLAFQAAVRASAEATEQLIDRAYLMRYLAVDRVIVNDEGPLHFYCNPDTPPHFSVGNGSNFYWYQAEAAPRFWLVPWDLDLAFDGTPWVTIQPEWSTAASCTCVAPPTMYAAQMPPSCDALVAHFVSWRADYDREVDAFIAGPFSQARVDAKLDAWATQLEPFVMEASSRPDAPSVDDWKYAVSELRKKIASQREHEGFAY
jgi:spore coat protein H